jgi:hypothetical protein
MAVALMWFARVPAGSQPWTLNLGHPASYLPPPSYWVDILPGTVLFGLGISTLVSPLTATLMGSVPPEHGGVASAFNNAVSRVGPQLAGSAVFVAVSATFFSQLGRHPAGLSPLNRPVDPALVSEAAGASVTAFHLAMGICVGMLLVGALIALFGLNSRPRS